MVPAASFSEPDRSNLRQMDLQRPTAAAFRPSASTPDEVEIPDDGSAEGFRVLRFLRSLPEFNGLSERELRQLATSCRLTSLEAGEHIVREGDPSNPYGFIVVSGCIAMSKTSGSGKVLVVELLQSGDVFGLLLMLALEKHPAQLSAQSIPASKVLWMPIALFNQLLSEHPDLFQMHVAHLLRCLQSSYNLARGLAHDRVEVRIAAVLSSLALKFANLKSSDKCTSVRFTRQQLANLTGTTGETAIRVTRTMQRDGMIDIARPGIIRILDLDGLHRMAQDW